MVFKPAVYYWKSSVCILGMGIIWERIHARYVYICMNDDIMNRWIFSGLFKRRENRAKNSLSAFDADSFQNT